ncbi:hypothetical protein [Pseudoalteromonas sp. R3]|uniref:hypothetical protein n=1 Tax=Pseudoalteromonas sp. R3 TaxID=1709477 RepID=UPI000AD564B6|nr:hypothetical protein [Pseudoalteromonas sp. R3]AZZ98104.1 hypothetical protein ELR70_13880 [Pseudoalteromonas sp. R3]
MSKLSGSGLTDKSASIQALAVLNWSYKLNTVTDFVVTSPYTDLYGNEHSIIHAYWRCYTLTMNHGYAGP